MSAALWALTEVKRLGMAEGEMQGAVASHGDAGDGAVGAAGSGAITFSMRREKFLKKQILVAVFCRPLH